jgi:hypothetical protein
MNTLTETQICKQFVKIVRELQSYKQFSTDFILLHIPNESKRSQFYGSMLKAMGMLAGAPDYLVLYTGGWAAIEFKRDKSSPQQKTQKQFQHRCNELGHRYLLTYNIDEAIEFLHNL